MCGCTIEEVLVQEGFWIMAQEGDHMMASLVVRVRGLVRYECVRTFLPLLMVRRDGDEKVNVHKKWHN